MSRRTPPFNALYAFVITAKHLNFTHAANELCVTQGAVSRQIATLEEYLGFAVFNRLARGLSLTAQGQEILPELQKAYDQLLTVTEKASLQRSEIRLKAPTCSMRWLVPKLMQFQQEKPHIHVSLTTTTDHDVNFRTENFDAGIVFRAAHGEGHHGLKLFEEAISPVIATHIAPSDLNISLEKYTLLHPTQDQTDWSLWLKETHHIAPNSHKHQYFNTMDLAISAAVQGFGIAMADVHLVEDDIRMKRLVKPFAENVKTGASYYLVHRSSSNSSQVLEEFISWFYSVAESADT